MQDVLERKIIMVGSSELVNYEARDAKIGTPLHSNIGIATLFKKLT